MVRRRVDRERLHRFMAEFGRSVRGPGAVFLTGGATALDLGLRASTNDIDLALDPEPGGAFEVLRSLKERLDLNLELARPSDFLPDAPGWRERCLFIVRVGEVDFFHYDPYSQALAKLERGHTQDLQDVRNLVEHGYVEPGRLGLLAAQVRARIVSDGRYLSLDPDAFAEKVGRFLEVRGHPATE